jgi:GNAT superfamily N-acetyltransferase
VSCLQIRIYEGYYDRTEFYGLMGRYFAEKKYRKEMPYLENSDDHIWFLAFIEGKLIGFGSVVVLKSKVVLSHSYVEEEHRRQGIWSSINEKRLAYAHEARKPIEVITKEPYLKEHWIKNGFSVYRMSGRYCYMRRDSNEN